METGERCFKTSILIFIAVITLLTPVVLIVTSQPQGYTLIYSPQRAYTGSDWMDVKAIYVKAEGNRLYFCIEYYGEMPNSPLYDRAIRIYMDTDRNIQTGGPGYSGYGAGWDCYIRFGLYGDGSTSDAYLERWNSTTGSWWRIEDVTLGVTSASSLSYMEIWIDQRDIGYTPDGICFYMDICSRLEAMPPAELSYIVGSLVKHITVDGGEG